MRTGYASLSRESAASEILGAIERCLAASGRPMNKILHKQAPLAAIPGFDSLCGVEVTVELEQRLGVKLGENIFVKQIGSVSRPRTLAEVCAALVAASR